MADPLQRLRVALVAIVSASAAMQAIANRVDNLLLAWSNLDVDQLLPATAYDLVGFAQTGKDNDTRAGTVRFSAFAQGNGALATTEAMLEAIELAVTAPALLAQGLDATPVVLHREYPAPEADEGDGVRQGSRGLERADLLMDLELVG